MTEKILIIDDDLDTLRLVGLMLQRQGYQISAATNGEQGLSKAFDEEPNLILLDVMMPDMDGYEVARRLRENDLTKDTPILMFTAKTQLDDKVAGFEVGADDYLTKPTHPAELQAHIKALLARSSKPVKESSTEVEEKPGFVICMLAARGGLGVTTLASNLSALLHNKTQAEVILAELRPGQGSLGLDMGISDHGGLAELLNTTPDAISSEKVLENIIPHGSGIKVLLASNRPRDFQLINAVNQYEKLVARLVTLSRFITLDSGVGLPPFVQKLLPMINQIVVVVEGVPNTITHTKALIDDLVELGMEQNNISVVLNNRVRSESQMAWATVQEQLGYPITATLTPAPELFEQAIRRETPAVLCQPDSLAVQQLNKLVDAIIERETKIE